MRGDDRKWRSAGRALACVARLIHHAGDQCVQLAPIGRVEKASDGGGPGTTGV